ncbi:MAG: hypothetical protein WCL32_15230 [Planctomycetota bacterium]
MEGIRPKMNNFAAIHAPQFATDRISLARIIPRRQQTTFPKSLPKGACSNGDSLPLMPPEFLGLGVGGVWLEVKVVAFDPADASSLRRPRGLLAVLADFRAAIAPGIGCDWRPPVGASTVCSTRRQGAPHESKKMLAGVGRSDVVDLTGSRDLQSAPNSLIELFSLGLVDRTDFCREIEPPSPADSQVRDNTGGSRVHPLDMALVSNRGDFSSQPIADRRITPRKPLKETRQRFGVATRRGVMLAGGQTHPVQPVLLHLQNQQSCPERLTARHVLPGR